MKRDVVALHAINILAADIIKIKSRQAEPVYIQLVREKTSTSSDKFLRANFPSDEN